MYHCLPVYRSTGFKKIAKLNQPICLVYMPYVPYSVSSCADRSPFSIWHFFWILPLSILAFVFGEIRSEIVGQFFVVFFCCILLSLMNSNIYFLYYIYYSYSVGVALFLLISMFLRSKYCMLPLGSWLSAYRLSLLL